MLHPVRLGIAGGLMWGLCMFVMTILGVLVHYGTDWLTLMMSIYPGYVISFPGSIVGLIYGFIDGFIGFFLLGYIYNRLE